MQVYRLACIYGKSFRKFLLSMTCLGKETDSTTYIESLSKQTKYQIQHYHTGYRTRTRKTANLIQENKISKGNRAPFVNNDNFREQTIPSVRNITRFMKRNDFRIPFSYNDCESSLALIILDSLGEYFFPDVGGSERAREGRDKIHTYNICSLRATHTREPRFSTPRRLLVSAQGVASVILLSINLIRTCYVRG